MNKYIVPTTKVVNLHAEETLLTATSFVVDPDTTVGGGDPGDVGQLTNGQGWNCEDWCEE